MVLGCEDLARGKLEQLGCPGQLSPTPSGSSTQASQLVELRVADSIHVGSGLPGCKPRRETQANAISSLITYLWKSCRTTSRLTPNHREGI